MYGGFRKESSEGVESKNVSVENFHIRWTNFLQGGGVLLTRWTWPNPMDQGLVVGFVPTCCISNLGQNYQNFVSIYSASIFYDCANICVLHSECNLQLKRNYTQIKKEGFAIIFAVKTFYGHKYILGIVLMSYTFWIHRREYGWRNPLLMSTFYRF